MLKKVFYTLLSCSVLFGDYYTSTDARLDGKKNLSYENGIHLIVDTNSIKVDSKYNLSYLIDTNIPQKYEDKVFNVDGKATTYKTYNFAYLLKNIVEDDKFVLKIKNGMMLVKLDKDDESIKTSFDLKKKDVIEYKYIVEVTYNLNNEEIDTVEDEILSKYIDNRGSLMAIELLDDGTNSIEKVENAKLKKFEKEKQKRIVVLKNFDFSKDKIYLSYINSTSTSTKRLNIIYENMIKVSKKTGRKSEYVKTVLKSPISLFDPESKSSTVEQNVGILKNYKNRELYEIKKVQLINQAVDV